MKRIYGCVLFALVSALPLAAAAQDAVTLRDVDVYAGPSSEFPPVARLAPDSPVRVAGCLGDWSWCDVSFADNRGWVYAADLGYPYENRRVAVIEYGPRLRLPVVSFSLQSYWDAHYRGRPWYGEREQWVSRVRIQGDRGGRPPEGHAAAPGRAVEGSATLQGAPQPGQAPAPRAGQAPAPQTGQDARATPQMAQPPERRPGAQPQDQSKRPPEQAGRPAGAQMQATPQAPTTAERAAATVSWRAAVSTKRSGVGSKRSFHAGSGYTIVSPFGPEHASAGRIAAATQ